jgi:hypothetical protein
MLERGADLMEVNLTPGVQAKLDRLAVDTGRPQDELLEDAVNGLYDELAHVRETLDRRYQEMAAGVVEAIDGEEAYRLLMARTQATRQRHMA